MNIVLSRKGFDRGSGGTGSPCIPEEGVLFSIPIPIEDSINYYTYRDLRFNKDLSCYDIMSQLGINKHICNSHCHTDPDIRENLFYQSDPSWQPILGQQGIPQKHLRVQGVGKGDIFLFYGLFRNVRKKNGIFEFADKKLKQIIWGYLQIGENPERVISNPQFLLHPHYYAHQIYRDKDENTVYHASNSLSFEPTKKGYGAFKYSQDLVLSREASERAEVYNIFMLPKHFFNHRMSGHPDISRWILEDNQCILRAANRGQEFVIKDNIEAEEWAKNLIKSSKIM